MLAYCYLREWAVGSHFDRHENMTASVPTDDHGEPARVAALELQNARLRAALERVGIDADKAMDEAAAAQRATRQARDDATTAAGDHVDAMERERAKLAGAEALNEDLRRSNRALAASEAALIESQHRLASLFAMKTLGVMFWGPEFGLTEVNDAFLAMTGYSRQEALGLTWQELTPEEFHPVSLRAVEEMKATGEVTPYEKQYFRKDGSRWWGLFAARKVDGEVLEVVLDVTDRRQVQEALREREEQLRLIVEGARDYAILTTDPQGRIIQWSPGAEAVFGWTAEEVLGQSGALIFTPEDREKGRPAEEMIIALEQGVAPDVRWHVRRDGSRAFIEGHMTALRRPDGELRGFLKIGQDVTERWTAEEQLRQSEAALRDLNETLEAQVDARTAELHRAVEALHAEALDRAQAEEALRQAQKMEAVGQLTGGLAHDFNNLLTGIIGSLDLMHTRATQGRYSDLDRYLAAARGAADRAAALTHRLLAFSRRQALDPKPTNLNVLVQGMAELLRRTIGPHITLEVTGVPDLWTTLCDPNQQENALLNLCINARDAMPDGGRLVIETNNIQLGRAQAKALDISPGPYVFLRVTDTGSGMPPEVIARAFDPFFTTKPLGQGTGLGLSMVYGFARQSGGQVQIDSRPGQGTSVAIYLPRHEGRAESGAAEGPVPSTPQAGANEAVLVVDDEPTVRMLVGEVLRELGYSTIEAADGASGLRILQSQAQVDLLVTDVGLPGGIDGRQLADRARATRPALKVLFITGYAGGAAIGALEPGMQLMTKPFAMKALASRIRDMLEDGVQSRGE
jgi:PAS domain S-box-containing protein